MGLFGKKRESKEARLHRELLERLDGKEMQYVIRRTTDANGAPSELVLGKGGRFIYANGHISVIAGNDEVFRNEQPETVACGELMALNGVLIEGYNLLTNAPDKIVAYYAYYRK